jgi:predicted oxidoreductase (fatty acid repression mutant protein)
VKIIDTLKERRSYYDISKKLPVKEQEVFELIKNATELVPDAFNMKSSRIVVVTKENQELLWDKIYDKFQGQVPREKIDGFKNGYGTILYFIDSLVLKSLETQFPIYAPKFIGWAEQSVGMLQLSIWSGLKELNIGASLQHYNPIIDDVVMELFDVPENYILNAQMPFGGINSEPDEKVKEDVNSRIRFL